MPIRPKWTVIGPNSPRLIGEPSPLNKGSFGVHDDWNASQAGTSRVLLVYPKLPWLP